MRAAVALLLVGFCVACSGSDGGETAAATAGDAACAATEPNGEGPPGEPASDRHHGNGRLWTILYYPTLVVTSRNRRPDGSIEEKFPWWRGVSGQLTIGGSGVGGSEGRVRGDIPPGYGDIGFQATSIIFPREGCWRVTGRAGSASLTFVVDVRAA
jgi:hypothetical protein